jgi:hypothetical protein
MDVLQMCFTVTENAILLQIVRFGFTMENDFIPCFSSTVFNLFS